MANYVSYSDATELMTAIANKLNGKVDTSDVGSANGVAELDANGKVPSAQLPSYVDDTVDGYLNSVDGKFYADSSYTTEITGETGKIYVTIDTDKTYRWSGSGFVEISESLALGETSSTAYAGNKGKANAEAIAAIKDGTNIDSFADVESAINNVNNLIGTAIRVEKVNLSAQTSLSTGFIDLQFSLPAITGYVPVGVLNYNFADRGIAQKIFMSGFDITGGNTAHIYGSVTDNITLTTNAYVMILYKKTIN